MNCISHCESNSLLLNEIQSRGLFDRQDLSSINSIHKGWSQEDWTLGNAHFYNQSYQLCILYNNTCIGSKVTTQCANQRANLE